eukprot:7053508-Prymnesium_polylepis.1
MTAARAPDAIARVEPGPRPNSHAQKRAWEAGESGTGVRHAAARRRRYGGARCAVHGVGGGRWAPGAAGRGPISVGRGTRTSGRSAGTRSATTSSWRSSRCTAPSGHTRCSSQSAV